MARISGVGLQDNWKIGFALTKIKGLGWSLSKKVLQNLKIEVNKKVKDLPSEEVSNIASEIEKFVIEGDLIRQVKANIQRLKTIGSYRGIRHTRGLPTRGQKTRRNARTKRGKRKTVGAFKKEALAKTDRQSK